MEEGRGEGRLAVSGLSLRCTHQQFSPDLAPPPTQQAHQQWRPASKIPRPHDAGQQVVTDASCHLHHKRVERVTRGHNLHHKRGSRQEELTMLSGTQEGLK